MPKTESLPVKSLSVDLKNYRTVPQKSEAAALRAMVSISPDWFWALMESLLDDGYLIKNGAAAPCHWSLTDQVAFLRLPRPADNAALLSFGAVGRRTAMGRVQSASRGL